MTLLRFTDEVSTQHEIDVAEVEITREFDRMWTARVFVRRDLFDASNVREGETDMYVVDDSSQSAANARFGGKFRDISRQGGITEVIVDSFERLAIYANPTPGGERWDNIPDDVIINDAISDIGEISAGDIATVDANISMLFSHATQSKKIRETAEVTGGEIRYNPDKTLDYVGALGSNRTGQQSITPSNQNITGNFEADRKGGEQDFTHLRVLGAGEGNHQRIFNFVPSSDPDSYDDQITYSNPNWAPGDLKKWEVISNKDIADPDALEVFGLNYIRDVASENYIDVSTTIRGVNISLGDSFHVVYEEEGIDHNMRVVKSIETILPDGTDYQVVLSTRNFSREEQSKKDRSDIQRYNKALQGQAVPINVAGGRQPVGQGPPGFGEPEAQSDFTTQQPMPQDVAYQMGMYYPSEVEYEHRLNIRVVGLPYRAYSAGALAGGNHIHDVPINITSEGNSDFENVVFKEEDFSGAGLTDSSWTTIASTTPSENTSVLWSFTNISTVNEDAGESIFFRLANVTEGTFAPVSDGVRYTVYPLDSRTSVNLQEATDTASDIIELQGITQSGDITITGTTLWIGLGNHNHLVDETQTAQASGPHVHDVHPGVIEQFPLYEATFYPQQCDIAINGTPLGISLGSGGPFEETVDIKGMLNPGQFNEILVSSETLGHLQVYVEGDVYRQILGNG